MTPYPHTTRGRPRAGFALILVLILVAVATVIGTAYVSAGLVRRTAVKNLGALEQGRYAAESALQHGMELFHRDPTSLIGHSLGPFSISTGGPTYTVSATCLDSSRGLYQLTGTATAAGVSRTATSKLYWYSKYFTTANALGPTGYWRLGDASTTVARDERSWQAGVYRSGVYQGETGAINADTNKAALFDGYSGYIDLGTANPAGSVLTLAAWVRPDGWANSTPRILSKAVGTGSPYWELYVVRKTSTKGTATFRLATGSTRSVKTVSANVDMTVGQWTFVVGTYSKAAGMIKLYQDGVLVGSTAHGGDISGSSTVGSWIGACAGYGLPWYGAIDEVMIFQKELADTEIKTLYDKRLGELDVWTWTN